MAFRPLRALPITDFKVAVIANSTTLAVGDAILGNVTAHAGSVIGASNTTARILGVVVAILGNNGTVTELNSIAVASDNETSKKYLVQYIPTNIPNLEYEAQLTAAAGTTTDSDGVAVSFNMDTATNSKLLESGVALFAATTKQFVSTGATPYDNTKIFGHFSTIAQY